MSEERLIALLQKKKNFFEAILDLSEMEHVVSIQEWIGILEQKKILLSCIEEIDAELGDFRKSLTFLSQDVSDELDELRLVIEKILHLDAFNLSKRKQEFHFPLPKQ